MMWRRRNRKGNTKTQGTLLGMLDHWLLIRFPFVWRSRIHYFVVFSLLLFCPLSWLAGSIYPVQLTNLPLPSQLTNIVLLLQLLGLLVLVYWAYKQLRIPVGEQPRVRLLKTWLYYAACIFLLYLQSIVFLYPLLPRVAALMGEEEWQELYSFHQEYNFWCCDPGLTDQLVLENKERILEDLQRFGFYTEARDIVLLEKSSFCENWDSNCLVASEYNSSQASPVGNKLQNSLNALQEARKFREGEKGLFSNFCHWSRLVLLPLVLAALVLFLGSSVFTFRNSQVRNVLNFRNFKFHFSYTNFVKRLDQYFLIHFPVLWSTKFHNFIVSAGIFVAILSVVALLVEWLWGVSALLAPMFSSDDTGIFSLLVIFTFVLIAGSYWGYFQVRHKYVPSGVLSNLLLIGIYFFLIYLIPGVLITVLWIALDSIGNESYSLTLLMISLNSIPIVGWVYSSKFMSNRQSLFLSLLTLGISIGGVIALVTFADPDDFGLPAVIGYFVVILSLLYFMYRKEWHKPLRFCSILYLSSLLPFIILLVNVSQVFGDRGAGDLSFVLGYLVLSIPVYSLFFLPSILVFLNSWSKPG